MTTTIPKGAVTRQCLTRVDDDKTRFLHTIHHDLSVPRTTLFTRHHRELACCGENYFYTREIR